MLLQREEQEPRYFALPYLCWALWIAAPERKVYCRWQRLMNRGKKSKLLSASVTFSIHSLSLIDVTFDSFNYATSQKMMTELMSCVCLCVNLNVFMWMCLHVWVNESCELDGRWKGKNILYVTCAQWTGGKCHLCFSEMRMKYVIQIRVQRAKAVKREREREREKERERKRKILSENWTNFLIMFHH